MPIMGGLTVCSVYFYHTEEWTERNQQLLEALSVEIRRCPRLWILAGDFNKEPETFGQYATHARLPGFLVKPAVPTFRHGASVLYFHFFMVHYAVACQIWEVRVLEDSGISPHHPVQMKLTGISSSRRTWMVGGHGSCTAPNRKRWNWRSLTTGPEWSGGEC